jgi:hypothetical protein
VCGVEGRDCGKGIERERERERVREGGVEWRVEGRDNNRGKLTGDDGSIFEHWASQGGL